MARIRCTLREFQAKLKARPHVPIIFSTKTVEMASYNERAIYVNPMIVWDLRSTAHATPEQLAIDLDRITTTELCCRMARAHAMIKCNTVLKRHPDGTWAVSGCPVPFLGSDA